MTPETFLACFEAIAEAPGGVKRLRELILQLAVRGRLVPQVAGEEPAEKLLERVDASRRHQDLARRTTRSRAASGTSRSEPYRLPTGWIWAPFSAVARIRSCLVSPAFHPDLPHVAPDTIEKGTGRLLPFRTVSQDGVASPNHHFRAGQILYSKIRPNLAKAVIVDFEGLCSADMYPIEADVAPRFLLLFMLSPPFLRQVASDDNRLAMPKVNQEQLASVAIPVPPLAEQHRIVAKVDELMALCDELEARRQKRQDAQRRAAAAALDALQTAEDEAALGAAWDRVRDGFDLWFEGPESVAPLRRVILQLAVRGKLVLQDAGDESAETLYGRMWEARDGVRPASGSERESPPHDGPFELPSGWLWCRVDDAGHVQLGRQRSPKDHVGPQMRPYLRVANVQENRLDVSDVLEMNFTDEEFQKFRLEPNDVLLNEGQSYELVGRPAIYRGEVPGVCFQNTLLRFRAHGELVPDYALIVFRAYMHGGRFRRASQQTVNIAHLSAGRLAAIEFPLAPLPEQHRIVAKVDELMAACDELEARLRRRREVHERLAAAAVRSLLHDNPNPAKGPAA